MSAVRPCTVVSTDDLIEEWAALRSLNYSQAFREVDFGSIEAAMFGTFEDAVDHGRDVIIDRTNMRFKSRNRFVQRAGNHYRRIAALFELPDDVLSERLKTRGDATGKRIPQNVIDDMRRTYEPPDARQFHHVVRVTP